MGPKTPMDYFVWDMSSLYDCEQISTDLYGGLAKEVNSKQVSDLLGMLEKQSSEKRRILDSCFEAVGASRQDVRCLCAHGLKQEHDEIARQDPSQEVLTMADLGVALKLTSFGEGAYAGLVDKAVVMGESKCATDLMTILTRTKAAAGKIEAEAHELNRQALQHA